jgi:transmembrane sensor
MHREEISATSGERTDDLEAQAWNWLRLLRSGDARAEDAKRFRRWVACSPAHRAAYATVKRRWDTITLSARKLLRRKPDAACLASAAPPPRQVSAGPSPSVRTLLAGVAVAYLPLGGWPTTNK